MEVNQLPTKPGPYYWRKSDGDEWARVFDVQLSNSIGLCVDAGFYYEPVQQRGGQWLPIPTAEELAELKAAKTMVDEGQDAWAVFNSDDNMVVNSVAIKPQKSINLHEKGKYDTWGKRALMGYTCRKVRVCKEAEND